MNKGKPYITFSEAVKSQAAPVFSCMIKPIGSECNLDCVYCYYLDKGQTIYESRKSVMSPELLEKVTKQYLEGNSSPEVPFVWHGGEPLLAGIGFYQKALALQKKYCGGKRVVNSLQTNGTLLNNEWCKFFHDNDFLIGISIDGPEDIHNAYRINKAGKPTFSRVIAGIEMIRKHRVEFNTLSVVNSKSEGRGTDVYRFLKQTGSKFMQFMPVVEYTIDANGGSRPVIAAPGTKGASIAPWSVSPLGYGKFLTDIFDEWVLTDVGNIFVQHFDLALAQWVGVNPGLCIYAETCGDALAVEHNGDVYSCDHFVYPEYRLGNITEKELCLLVKDPGQVKFGLDKRNTLPRYCLSCRFYFACRGECPKHRFLTSPAGEANLNALCEGFKYFYNHIEPYMERMKSLLLQNRPPAEVMEWARRGRSQI